MRMLKYLKHVKALKDQQLDIATEQYMIDEEIKESSRLFQQDMEDNVQDAAFYFEERQSNIRYRRVLIDAKIAIMKSDYLVDRAIELEIPLPEDGADKYWETGIIPGGLSKQYLNVNGAALLKSAIRREVKERIEIWQTRLALIFSVIGAVTGILSLILSKK